MYLGRCFLGTDEAASQLCNELKGHPRVISRSTRRRSRRCSRRRLDGPTREPWSQRCVRRVRWWSLWSLELRLTTGIASHGPSLAIYRTTIPVSGSCLRRVSDYRIRSPSTRRSSWRSSWSLARSRMWLASCDITQSSPDIASMAMKGFRHRRRSTCRPARSEPRFCRSRGGGGESDALLEVARRVQGHELEA